MKMGRQCHNIFYKAVKKVNDKETIQNNNFSCSQVISVYTCRYHIRVRKLLLNSQFLVSHLVNSLSRHYKYSFNLLLLEEPFL